LFNTTYEGSHIFSVDLKLGTMDSWYNSGKRFIFESNINFNHVSPRTLHEDGGEAVYVHGESLIP
jgi:hypothetical protein